MDRKNVPVSSVRGVDGVDGIVEAIVSVTNVVDSVNDLIEPGAYKTTLRKRNPKGVWSHDTNIPVAKTLKVEELMPGDSRLPDDLRNQNAGALLVKMQFNLNTTRGRDAFHDVQFFAEEQEWSIGYSVPEGKSVVDDKSGVRFIKALELYEYSPVIFGAAPNTRTLSVKEDDAPVETQHIEIEETPKARGDYSDLNFSIPSGVKSQARTGLKWAAEFNRGGTSVGKNTARYLLANDTAGPEKVRHIARYFPRHEVDLRSASNRTPGADGYPGAGLIAWKLWGGTPGWRWAQKLVDAMNRRDEMKAGPKELSVGDFVSWNSSGGMARGRIEHVMRKGTLGVPGSSFSIRASEEDPAALIRIWKNGPKGWEETETLVGHKFSTLTKIQSLKGDQSKDVFTDMPTGEPGSFGTPTRRRRRRRTPEGKPYRISNDLQGCSGYAVIKEGESSPVPGGCHETLAEARRHMAALYAAETQKGEQTDEVKAAGGPIRGHSTAVSDETRLNRQAILSVRSPEDPAYYRKIFAYQIKGTDGTRKTHYTFIHHFVGEDGRPGAAALSELRAQMTVLNGGRTGTTLRGAERRAVYNHLARHYRDGGETPPSLKSDAEVDTIMIKNGIISEPLTKVEKIDE